MKIRFIALSLALPLFFLTSCEEDEENIPDEPVNEEELITTVNLNFEANGQTSTFTFQDLDGEGGDAPVIDDITLSANTVYTLTLEFLNEQEDPAEDITEEVLEEDEEHQVFFAFSNDSIAMVEYSDVDGDGNPIGVENSFETYNANSGTFTATLRHEPSKDGAGVSDGDITNAGGETDIEVTFNITIQ